MEKEKYPKYPNVRATYDDKFILEMPYQVKNILIPKGYKSNGANIPRIFWSLIPPNKPKYQPAIMIHDYLCDKEMYKLADDLFEEVLFDIEISWKTKAMVRAVRLYHKIKY